MTTRLIASFIVCCSLASFVQAQSAVKVTPDVVYGHKVGMALTMDVMQPTSKANGAGVMFMVSGGWYSRWSPPNPESGIYKPLLDKGFTVFAVRHGSSPKFSIPEVVSDVRQSVRFVRVNAKRFGIDPKRIGVYGGSAGGHLSLMLGTTSNDGDPNAEDAMDRVSDRVAAVVAFYPPTDIRPWVTDPESSYYKNYPALQFDPKKADEYSPLLHVSEDDCPTLLVHGDKDKLVPINHSEKILVEFEEKRVPSMLVVIDGAAHGFKGDEAGKARDALLKWFESHLLE